MAAVSYCSGTPCGGRDVMRKLPIGAYSHHWFPGGGGAGTRGYSLKSYRYVPPQRVGPLRCFGLKTGIDFAHFGLESGMGIEGITGVLEFKKSFFAVLI